MGALAMVIWSILEGTLMITAFVAVMMILVEYINVLTLGRWKDALWNSRWSQYLVAALLGATPGCLGAFVVVTLYLHRSISLGAVVACMIATSGDEAFVMLAMFPGTALLLTAGLAIVGLAAGVATDLSTGSRDDSASCPSLVLHREERECRCFAPSAILPQLRRPSAARGVLAGGTLLVALALLSGAVGPSEWNWIRFTLLGTTLFALFVIATVPEHFIEDHLWRHVALRHLPRIFLWTFGALAVIAGFDQLLEVESIVRTNSWLVLVIAGLVGILPESGPHLLFVTLFDNGTVPLSVLAASSIVQDGHGMLPLLAHSRRDFFRIKGINLLAGLLVGAMMLSLGG
jgi:hypothetical protein